MVKMSLFIYKMILYIESTKSSTKNKYGKHRRIQHQPKNLIAISNTELRKGFYYKDYKKIKKVMKVIKYWWNWRGYKKWKTSYIYWLKESILFKCVPKLIYKFYAILIKISMTFSTNRKKVLKIHMDVQKYLKQMSKKEQRRHYHAIQFQNILQTCKNQNSIVLV
jgi:hypothetical protein